MQHFALIALNKNRLWAVWAMIVISLSVQYPLLCRADVDAQLLDPALAKQFEWAMFVEMNDNKPYLAYSGSKLSPLTFFRITLNTYPREPGANVSTKAARLYEEFWYHDGTPIGQRRFSKLNVERSKVGAIFLGSSGTNDVAAANVLLRLAVELDFQGLSPSSIEVPIEKYDAVVAAIEHYSFLPKLSGGGGRQFSIHLRSYPYKSNKDAYYYLQH